MRRRETFATSGTRIRVRFFGGWNYEASADERPDVVEYCYENGVPMGSDLPVSAGDTAPNFVVWATRDPNSALLERIQIIKGWMTNDGNLEETIFDAAIEISGSPELSATWTDPSFDPDQRAFYYARVLEVPTPRWSTLDAMELGIAPPEDTDEFIKERAWASAIWYTPADF